MEVPLCKNVTPPARRVRVQSCTNSLREIIREFGVSEDTVADDVPGTQLGVACTPGIGCTTRSADVSGRFASNPGARWIFPSTICLPSPASLSIRQFPVRRSICFSSAVGYAGWRLSAGYGRRSRLQSSMQRAWDLTPPHPAALAKDQRHRPAVKRTTGLGHRQSPFS